MNSDDPLASQPASIFTFNKRYLIVLEILLLAAWTLWIGSEYVNLDPLKEPSGREFGSTVQYHHFWENLLKCGSCALWNGAQQGGFPALADIFSATFNPIVAITTLLFGVINGVKISLLLAIFLAGIAQWWLAFQLNLSRLARIWTGLIAISGGHLAAKMELGWFNAHLTISMGSLVIAAAIALYRKPNRRNMGLLAIASGAAILGGSGYMQVSLLALLPGFMFFVLDSDYSPNHMLIKYAKSAGISLLIAAPIILPFILFSSNFVKGFDPEFSSVQPLKYLVLNLVISDYGYYVTDVLEKLPYPHLYALFIGWLPVILAGIGIAQYGNRTKAILGFLVTGIISIFLVATATPLRFLVNYLPALGNIRYAPSIAGMAIPAILILSAIGLDQAIKWNWPTIRINFGNRRAQISTVILLFVLLIGSLNQTKEFAKNWYYTVDYSQSFQEVIDALKTPSTQWVNTPFGEHYWVERAVSSGLKLSPGVMPFSWAEREFPEPYLAADRVGPPSEAAELVDEINGVPIYDTHAEPYAAIYHNDETSSECIAHAVGGNIEVTCPEGAGGVLVVRENLYMGWKAQMNGQPVELLTTDWISLNVPQGEKSFVFNYEPIDALVGILMGITGWVVAIYMVVQKPNEE